MTIYLTNTFSPMMIAPKNGNKAPVLFQGKEVSLSDIMRAFRQGDMISAVSHEATAEIFSMILGENIEFNRASLKLEKGDKLYVMIPNFRADKAREFTKAELSDADVRCFIVACL